MTKPQAPSLRELDERRKERDEIGIAASEPWPPDVLASAIQYRIHETSGKLLASKPVLRTGCNPLYDEPSAHAPQSPPELVRSALGYADALMAVFGMMRKE